MNISKNHRFTFGIISGLVLILAMFLTLSRRNAFNSPGGFKDYDSGYRQVMGTLARVVAIAADEKTARQSIRAAFEQLELVDDLMSTYKADSQISILNREAYERAVEINEPLFEVLQKSIFYSQKTNGAFDITVGPVIDLYKKSQRDQVVPTAEEIAEASIKVGYEKLQLDEQARTVKFTVEGMRLDLGGIAKGYAIDKAVEAMQDSGVEGGMVDVGGDIRCFGAGPRDNGYWKIGLQNPKDTSQLMGGEIVLKLKLTDSAVTTSGDYRRFTMIGDKKISHIIDRNTASGVKGLSSVTIIAEMAVDADALATAVSVMGPEKGIDLIESIPNTEAILIRSDQADKLIQTSGADKYIE
ncbi:MAG: FAD:protein FMN transferase [Planctomycetota bacterium]